MLDPAIRTMIDQNISDVEREAHRILDEWGVPYEKQARVGFYFIDIYVARDNLAIEIAGCYWHACKKCGFDDPGRRKADARRTVFLRKHGYKVATVWEHDMKRDPYAALNDAFKGI